MDSQEARTFNAAPLTESGIASERCQNPFCDHPMKAKAKNAPIKLYYSSPCKMDGYVLRRAKQMLNEVGIVELNRILEGVKR